MIRNRFKNTLEPQSITMHELVVKLDRLLDIAIEDRKPLNEDELKIFQGMLKLLKDDERLKN